MNNDDNRYIWKVQTKTAGTRYNIYKYDGKKQVYYGSYDTIEEARKIRDKLEKNEWKKIPTRKNEKNKNKTPRYIQKDKYNKYVLIKSIDGDFQYFGTFKTRSAAVEERDFLITHNWNYDDV